MLIQQFNIFFKKNPNESKYNLMSNYLVKGFRVFDGIFTTIRIRKLMSDIRYGKKTRFLAKK